MSDEPLHEIQLNGKQLVFLFMAVTVVAVVIFLCGVMVGRGVRPPLVAGLAGPSADAGLDPTAMSRERFAPPGRNTDSASMAAQETLTYSQRLEGPGPPPEALHEPIVPVPQRSAPAPPPPAVVPAPPARTAEPQPARAAEPQPARAPTAAPLAAEPRGNGFVVQVASFQQRSAADTVARRLASKGYPSFVTVATPAGGSAQVFRVRVGKYSDRREAEAVAGRLEREEQFKPLITR